MDNPETLTAYGTQDEEKQSENTTQCMLDTTMRKQIHIAKIRHESSYKQLEVNHCFIFFNTLVKMALFVGLQ